MYTLTLNLNKDFVTNYKKITTFNKFYQERLIEIYALSEPVRTKQFEFNGHSYSSKFGSYHMDGTAITKEDYNDAINAYRDAEVAKLEAERYEIVKILEVKQTDATKEYYKYQVTTLYEEIMLQMDTYALTHERTYVKGSNGYTSCKDVFVFEDTITPMIAYSYLRKIYPHFMNYIDSFTLTDENGTVLTDFKLLNV